MIEAIFNHPVLSPTQVFGAIYLGTLTGSLKDPVVLVAYAFVIVMSFRKVRVAWIGMIIFAFLASRFLISVHWSISAGLSDESFADRAFTSGLVFFQIALVGMFTRMFSNIELVAKPK
jgi:hypothetical protein